MNTGQPTNAEYMTLYKIKNKAEINTILPPCLDNDTERDQFEIKLKK